MCSANEFPCSDGFSCVPMAAKCNGYFECIDQSDESPSLCHPSQSATPPPRGCVDGQFQCRQTLKCIPNNWLCDGDYDCGVRDTSDEDRCHQTKKCPPNQSACEYDVCIHTGRFCDGHNDCANDEDHEMCREFCLLF